MRIPQVRNFSIIAHIDHGKSTLADRILEVTGALPAGKHADLVLDAMDLEREKGITIKASVITLHHRRAGETYTLNLIDTPGHVDFSYEVSRSLAACEGALLLVDAAQGVEAQTVANAYLAADHNLVIIPVINKIDLPQALPDQVAEEMKYTLGIDSDEILLVSAKQGLGIDEVLDAVVDRIPPPEHHEGHGLRALIFDAEYNEYRGVIVYLRVFEGEIKPKMRVLLCGTKTTHEVTEVGTLTPGMHPRPRLGPGEVGYMIAGIRSLDDVGVGDTVTEAEAPSKPLPGYRQPQPMVYCGLYPSGDTEFRFLREALAKLRLNDSSFVYEPEHSDALGPGFRCGFLGMLHMEIVQERLERESQLELVKTAPNVTYEVLLKDGSTRLVHGPDEFPAPDRIAETREPLVRADFVCPAEHIGNIMRLCEERRGRHQRTEYLSPTRAILVYDLPLAEVIFDFYDKLKSATRGFGTMDYEFLRFEQADIAKIDILIAGRRVDALSTMVHQSKAVRRGRALVQRLRREIDRHLFEIPIQAAIGGRIIARETIRPLAKNVTAKCYGGDITRKRKLLEKQKEGKRRMKQVGNVRIPQEAFLSVLTVEDEK